MQKTITRKQLYTWHKGDDPIKLADGKFGLVIRYGMEIGVQVPGESDIRWIPLANIEYEGGALVEKVEREK